MIINKKQIKKILIINVSFWILPAVFIIISLFSNYANILSKDYINFMKINIYKILLSNLGFYICLILLGFIHKKLPYVLFYYNSIIFTGSSIIYLDTNKLSLYLIKIIPHGILEIMGLSIATYIGINLKNEESKNNFVLFIIGIFLIIISAIIEVKISYKI